MKTPEAGGREGRLQDSLGGRSAYFEICWNSRLNYTIAGTQHDAAAVKAHRPRDIAVCVTGFGRQSDA